ncbi:hypothetical protein HGO38_16405 [Rhizobium sp. CG5]|uniref:hypothetical protein n=1 Tax=Rhizobium sp. CG5 TaxID=2726076 RepID=UPI0020335D9E|nr:hypothetical protein [Rhizobium sp. CG5]MCM2475063.1 hypothetical protein [Rhizobium sp. CG5]
MKRNAVLSMIAFLMATPAMAACPDGGISKDGTHTPLETQDQAQAQPGGAVGTTTRSSEPNAIQKDGTTVPMAQDPNLATSAQDTTAQQKGDRTAAASSADASCD